MSKLLRDEFQLKVINLQRDENQKIKFRTITLPDFYKLCLLRDNFPVFSKHTWQTTSLFGSTYISRENDGEEPIQKSAGRWKVQHFISDE
jgi:hypothetical protein